DAPEPLAHVELLDETEAVGHHALVGLPALPRHEMEQRPGFLPATEEQVEELVDEGIVRGQRHSGKHGAGNPVQEPALETGADALHDQVLEPVRVAGGEFQGQDAAERHAKDARALQAMPVEELLQVADQVAKAEGTPQGKAILLAPELVADDAKVAGQ